ncbi:MAG: PGF-CTERM sorting domain-containing protein, partial [Thermoplasmata archaeon]
KGTTNASGVFQILNLTPGYYPVDAAYFDSIKNFEMRAHREFGVACGPTPGMGPGAPTAGGFIMMEVLVEALHADAIPNDVKVIVKDQDGTPINNSKVFFNGNLKGTTNASGIFQILNLTPGYYPVDAAYFDSIKNFEMRAHREFGVSGGPTPGMGPGAPMAGGFIMMEVLVEARDIDGIPNDVKVVVKDQDGTPVNNSKVFFKGNLKGTTDANGTFTIRNLTAGYYPVDAAYFDSIKNFEMRAHREFGVTGGAVTGTGATAGGFIMMDTLVQNLDNGTFSNDVQIIVKDQDGKLLQGAKIFVNGQYIGTTDANGSYTRYNVPPGFYVVDASYFDPTKNFELKAHKEFGAAGGIAGPTAGFQAGGFITLDAFVQNLDNGTFPNDVQIIVKDQDGKLLQGAKLFVNGQYLTTTDANGSYIKYNVAPGFYVVDASYFDPAKNFEQKAHREFGAAGGIAGPVTGGIQAAGFITMETLVLNLDNGTFPNDLQVFIKDQDGVPINNVKIFFNGRYEGTTNVTGALTRMNVPAGRFGIDAEYFNNTLNFAFRAHKEIESKGQVGGFIIIEALVQNLDNGTFPNDIQVMVKDQNNMPLKDAKIFFSGRYEGMTNETGAFTRYNVPAGKFDVGAEYFDATLNYALRAQKMIESQGQIGGFITIRAYLIDADNDGMKDDVQAMVSDNNYLPVNGAKIFFNGRYEGMTNDTGFFTKLNIPQGRFGIDTEYLNATFNFIFRAHAEVDSMGAVGGFIYVKAYLIDANNDTRKDDIQTIVYSDKDEPLAGAKVFFNGRYEGITDANGGYIKYNAPSGKFGVDAQYFNATLNFELRAHADIESQGNKSGFIYTHTYLVALDADGIKNDIQIIVCNETDMPVGGAEIYIGQQFVGKTENVTGMFTKHNVSSGKFEVNAFYYDAERNFKFRSSEPFESAGEYGFIYTFSLVLDADDDGKRDDLKVAAYDWTDHPLKDVRIYVDGVYVGATNELGWLYQYNVHDGKFKVDAYWNNMTLVEHGVELRSHEEFESEGNIGTFMYIDIFVLDADSDGLKNDIQVIAYNESDMPFPGTEIYFDGKYVGTTDANGSFIKIGAGKGEFDVAAFRGYLRCNEKFKSEGQNATETFYIFIEAFVMASDADNLTNDARIMMFDNNGTSFAEAGVGVFVDDNYAGVTNSTGEIYVYNITEGDHVANLIYMRNNVEYKAETKFYTKGVEGYIYADAFMYNETGGNNSNDMKMFIYDENKTSLDNDDVANITIDGVTQNLTSGRSRASYINFNTKGLSAGAHTVKVTTTDGKTSEVTIISEGNGEPFIWTQKLTLDSDSDGSKDDVRIYVYDKSSNLVSGATVYVDGVSKGTTNANGWIEVVGVTGEDFGIGGSHTGKAIYNSLEANIGVTVLDGDFDGMPDAWEQTYGLNPRDASDAALDKDSDTYTNLAEYVGDSNPTNATSTPIDRDGDGYLNEWETFLSTNPNSYTSKPTDTDSDGKPDGDATNSKTWMDTDDDNDGMPDAWELQYSLNPKDAIDASSDADSDTYTNLQEYTAGTKPNDAASTPKDTDGDGYQDEWETFLGTNPNSSASKPTDTDGDGKPDGDATNSKTWMDTDDDNDGMPDDWELQNVLNPASASDNVTDKDSDTYSNLAEYTAGSNASDAKSTPVDWDGDGYLNEWETALQKDPKDANSKPTDTDKDGKPDGDKTNSQPWMDTDDDNDKVADDQDKYPLDSTKSKDAEQPVKKGFLPGFEMAFAILSMLGVAALVARRRRL